MGEDSYKEKIRGILKNPPITPKLSISFAARFRANCVNKLTHNDFLGILARLHLSCLTYVSHLLRKTESENL